MGGCAVAGRNRNRSRYRKMESTMMKVLIGDGVLFFLYTFAASREGGWVTIKWICAVCAILISVLGLVWLYLTQELTRRRSLWMVTTCVAILICLLVSLCLGYPCPPVVALTT